MAVYYKDSGLSYDRYLQEQAWVDDVRLTLTNTSSELAGLSREAMEAQANDAKALRDLVATQGEAVVDEIAAQTSLMTQGFRVLTNTMNDGLTQLHVDLGEVNSQLAEISATLEAGFGRVETAIGALGTSLEELIKIARTPEQTWAFEQYFQAVTASRRLLFPEALESATRAIGGYGTHPGYGLEHRFHRLLGHIRWAAVEDDIRDLAQAEKHYLDAVRLARSVSATETSACLLRAAQLAYGRGDAAAAFERASDALKLDQGGQQCFLLAKYALAIGRDRAEAFGLLKQAISHSPTFFLLAVDRSNAHEFTPHEAVIHGIAEMVIDEKRPVIDAALAASREAVHAFDEINGLGARLAVSTDKNARDVLERTIHRFGAKRSEGSLFSIAVANRSIRELAAAVSHTRARAASSVEHMSLAASRRLDMSKREIEAAADAAGKKAEMPHIKRADRLISGSQGAGVLGRIIGGALGFAVSVATNSYISSYYAVHRTDPPSMPLLFFLMLGAPVVGFFLGGIVQNQVVEVQADRALHRAHKAGSNATEQTKTAMARLAENEAGEADTLIRDARVWLDRIVWPSELAGRTSA